MRYQYFRNFISFMMKLKCNPQNMMSKISVTMETYPNLHQMTQKPCKHAVFNLKIQSFPAKYFHFFFCFLVKIIHRFQKRYVACGHRRLDFSLFKFPCSAKKNPIFTFSVTAHVFVYNSRSHGSV